jgi:beta-glucanase (GH16 family)
MRRHALLACSFAACAVSPAQERLVVQLDPKAPASGTVAAGKDGGVRLPEGASWIDFDLDVALAGRYRCEIQVADHEGPVVVWVEDYIGNPDGRCYDITGPTTPAADGLAVRLGSPLDRGPRRMRLHCQGGPMTCKSVAFELVRPRLETPTSHVQRTDGESWTLAWSDEFDGEGLPDPRNWTHDLGDWGWGNRELQHYTEGRVENARQQDGCLVIEARKNDQGCRWTSARLTTRGKRSFLYGRIEMRAKVPSLDGAWAAGWLLGDAYRDEKSWPYCGEVDVLEGVGREIDDHGGSGQNHASCHTRAYYFKQGNHISSTTEVPRMAEDFHVYGLEWLPDRITIDVDGKPYYVYDKTDGPLEWPFAAPQNLILNLAMGGGMGGDVADGVDRVAFVIDYVRVYGRQ